MFNNIVIGVIIITAIAGLSALFFSRRRQADREAKDAAIISRMKDVLGAGITADSIKAAFRAGRGLGADMGFGYGDEELFELLHIAVATCDPEAKREFTGGDVDELGAMVAGIIRPLRGQVKAG